jgi:hypothetical protein
MILAALNQRLHKTNTNSTFLAEKRFKMKLRHRGIEPRPFAWKAKILTIRPMALWKFSTRPKRADGRYILLYRFI